MTASTRAMAILDTVSKLAAEYRELTGKPLGVTGEVAEYHAARLLGLELVGARTPGHDATRVVDGKIEKIQIKGRVLLPDAKPGQRLGTIKQDADADRVVVVLLNQWFQPTQILEADMGIVRERLARPGSKARARGALGLAEFRRFAKVVWRRD
ncbi:MAG: hypothetical protein AAF566_09180 [Pseudomonadota bacterium]